MSSSQTEVAIIGAGPYGLSVAAHLHAGRVPFRIFGPPMHTWARRMPAGMRLKSDGFASCLYAPGDGFTLGRYCATQGLPYADLGLPVPLETFVDYGIAFQRQLVPMLEPVRVTALRAGPDGFSVRLENGETLSARHAVMATGVSHMEYVPPVLSGLPPELCSHSAEHHDLSGFRGREVIVLGAGASATDVAGLLHEAEASVSLLARHSVAFHSHSPGPPSLWTRLTKPNLGLGPNFRSAVYTAVPGLFRLAPLDLRLRIVRGHLGPAGGWFAREMVEGKVPFHSGYVVQQAQVQRSRAVLQCLAQDGSHCSFEADHVIAATGYRVDLSRLGMLDEALLHRIATEDGSPRLSRSFESSVPGLYFVGLAAAASFGPLLRFAVGAQYTARRVSAHLSRRYHLRARRASGGLSKDSTRAVDQSSPPG